MDDANADRANADSTEPRALLHHHINHFYQALRSRQFEQTALVMDALSALPAPPDAQAWATYFSGILADEEERDWAKAVRIYRRLLDHPLDGVLRAHVLLSLGNSYHKHANWRDAVSCCTESAALWASLGYPIKQAVALRQLAITYHSGFTGGEFAADALQSAVSHCQRALDLLAACTPETPDPPLYQSDVQLYLAASWNTLGAIHSCAGNWQEATACFERFRHLCVQRNDRFLGAFALTSLADAYQQSDPAGWPQAHVLYEQASAIFREFQDPHNEFLAWAHRGRLHQKEGAYAAALACYEQSLSMVEEIRRGISSEEARSGFFATVVNIYANAFLVQAQSGDMAASFHSTERARSRAFLDSLVSGVTDFSTRIEATPLTAAAVQAQLAGDAIMLVYFTTGLFASTGHTTSAREAARDLLFPAAKSFLFALTQTSITLIDLDLDPNQLMPQVQMQWVEANFLATPIRRALYRKLVQPCADLLRDKRRIYLIPHGPLHFVPLHALLAPDGESWLRDAGPTFVYAPSASVLLRPRSGRATPPLQAALVVGYNGQGATRLRFAEEEARCIAQLLHGQSLLGAGSTTEALFQRAVALRILHFACHGEFDAGSPLLSKLYIGPDAVLTGEAILESAKLECQLVVLSACESALSQVRRGDELYGLARAFFYTGAQALIASLWRVNDSATLLLMEEFYRNLVSGKAVAEALKVAQLYVKTLTRSQAVARLQHLLGEESIADLELRSGGADDYLFAAPQHWAAFILIGEPD